jgi:hypothetical protein
MGVHGLFHGLKRLGLEADHSPKTSAEVKNECAILPLHAFNAWTSKSILIL